MADIANQHTAGNREIISRKAMVPQSVNAMYEGPLVRNVFNCTSPKEETKSQRSDASRARRLTSNALHQLGKLGSLHETDIFKICTKTMQRS
jgi:hypothetical protein